MSQETKNLVSKEVAILSSILIPISFVLFVDLIKKIAASKLIKKRNNNRANFNDYSKVIEYEINERHSYREAELKIFLKYSFIYPLILIIGNSINFNIIEVYFSPKNNKTIYGKVLGTITILIINFILYSGLLIQFFMNIEYLYPKTSFCFFMENIYGPILEEFIYRGLLFTLLKEAGYNGIKSAIYSSLTFSLSHFRHVFDIYFSKKEIPRLFFQSFYTLLFGFYTCYAYNYSGTIFAPILLHGICNTLQMPRFNYLSNCTKIRKNIISIVYIIGILSWIILIKIFH
jgi:membrane protease YdiL (CAAX protease family)